MVPPHTPTCVRVEGEGVPLGASSVINVNLK
jgi:hypothetical protein